MSLMITSFYAGLLGLCYLYLSGLVIHGRIKGKVSLGDGGDCSLNRLIRAHSNFSEYVPITLILLACLEVNSAYTWPLHVSALLLLFGRILHAFGLRHHVGPSWQRLWGMLMTFFALAFLSIGNLTLLYWGSVI
ncbi:glutathione S-transferase [Alteromonas sediminis]|uniref:Glutathione S-transferase n=1 Tax=Alteromonas sediminis TaxID=2259342 RepID=A0A3N5XYE6_9ALTE|nr:MAPEG family protein [Alteromonas sediminis]RPJ64916.1 glutathione S-transferase [Alteromonas sediminis]